MDKERLLQDLKSKQEIVADSYDGSYELVREVVASYATIDDFSKVTYLDMNAIYLMAVGTWKINAEKKKEKISQGCLPQAEKQRLNSVIDKIWDNACKGLYEHKTEEGSKKPIVGMFGTGFYSFENKTTTECAQRFVEMLVDISRESEINEEIILSKTEKVINGSFKGMKAASASVVLHCLMPTVFPIINGNMGSGNIFVALGIDIEKPAEIGTYISNVRKIKAFRDNNLPFKNYRILDVMAWNLPKYESDDYIPSLYEYNPGISSDKYIEIFQNEDIVRKSSLDTIYLIYQMGGEASCKQIEKKYGGSYAHYNSNATVTAKAVYKATNCELSQRDEGGDRYWAILFQGRDGKAGEDGVFVWKLRPELSTAIAVLDEAGFFEGLIMKETTVFDHNTILYGPPGTGKTYNTIVYAVSIVEKKPFADVQAEAVTDYNAVKQRYDEYKSQGKIAFTTFHQSYGYEEFIQGIKPNMSENEEDVDLKYSVEDGVFKAFCDKAALSNVENTSDYGFNVSPAVWKVSLEGTGDNPTRQECLENNHIRIGWDGYGPKITDETDFIDGGKTVLNAFLNKMKIGDIVLSCYSSTNIDAIGVVIGDYEWHDEYSCYKRLRKVNWLVKNIRKDIVALNGGTGMTLSSVYQMKVSVADVLNILSEFDLNTVSSNGEQDNYVFIIDEINRGNISKIFGELITLIETTKRIGAEEEMTVSLPYTPNKPFGVPKNVYILGTMNTADRSIALMDTALRRRFSFIEMLPRPELLDKVVVSDKGESVNIGEMLRKINKRIEHLYDREHTIGHAPFMKLVDEPSMDNLAGIFAKSVIPLLQEYFYEDYAKIRMVLGDNAKTNEDDQFVVERVFGWDDDFLGDQPDEVDIPNQTYEIMYENFNNIRCYKGIIEKL